MALLQQFLKVIEVHVFSFSIACNWYKEPYEEEYQDQHNEDQSVLQSPESFRSERLAPFAFLDFVELFIVEVSERDDQETENSIEAVESKVNNL
jgi:hypothetical protein